MHPLCRLTGLCVPSQIGYPVHVLRSVWAAASEGAGPDGRDPHCHMRAEGRAHPG